MGHAVLWFGTQFAGGKMDGKGMLMAVLVASAVFFVNQRFLQLF